MLQSFPSVPKTTRELCLQWFLIFELYLLQLSLDNHTLPCQYKKYKKSWGLRIHTHPLDTQQSVFVWPEPVQMLVAETMDVRCDSKVLSIPSGEHFTNLMGTYDIDIKRRAWYCRKFVVLFSESSGGCGHLIVYGYGGSCMDHLIS